MDLKQPVEIEELLKHKQTMETNIANAICKEMNRFWLATRRAPENINITLIETTQMGQVHKDYKLSSVETTIPLFPENSRPGK